MNLDEQQRAWLIDHLKQIKFSIIVGAGGGVTDTAWMHVIQTGRDSSETICDRIDGMLTSLGCDLDELESEADFWSSYGRGKNENEK